MKYAGPRHPHLFKNRPIQNIRKPAVVETATAIKKNAMTFATIIPTMMSSFPISMLNACSGVNARTSYPQKFRNLRLRCWRSDRPAYSEKIILKLPTQRRGTRKRCTCLARWLMVLKFLQIYSPFGVMTLRSCCFSASLRGSGLTNRPSQAQGNLLRQLTPKNRHF